jgi:hypothetical protein
LGEVQAFERKVALAPAGIVAIETIFIHESIEVRLGCSRSCRGGEQDHRKYPTGAEDGRHCV